MRARTVDFMDWATVGASLLSGGTVGGAISVWVARHERQDRQDALNLEREKWEHQKAAVNRASQLEVIDRAVNSAQEVHYILGNGKYLELSIEDMQPMATEIFAVASELAVRDLVGIMDTYLKTTAAMLRAFGAMLESTDDSEEQSDAATSAYVRLLLDLQAARRQRL